MLEFIGTFLAIFTEVAIKSKFGDRFPLKMSRAATTTSVSVN